LLRRSLPNSPSWIHGQARGEIGKEILAAYSTVGRNVVVPFAFPEKWFRYVDLLLFYVK
jgi:hypothetical protein